MPKVILNPSGPDFGPDGRLEGVAAFSTFEDLEMTVRPRLYNVMLTVGPLGDPSGYTTHWCFDKLEDAIEALEEWDPATQAEPEGWFRHVSTGRRRPGGDKNQEYVNP